MNVADATPSMGTSGICPKIRSPYKCRNSLIQNLNSFTNLEDKLFIESRSFDAEHASLQGNRQWVPEAYDNIDFMLTDWLVLENDFDVGFPNTEIVLRKIIEFGAMHLGHARNIECGLIQQLLEVFVECDFHSDRLNGVRAQFFVECDRLDHVTFFARVQN